MQVDLAGSERLARSESEGQRLREAQSINSSLSALGKVVMCLDPSVPTSYIPCARMRARILRVGAPPIDQCVFACVQVP